MLLMSNLFLWEKAASVPVSGYDGMSLHELLDEAMTESSNIKELTAEMHRIFVSISLIFGFFFFTKWIFKSAFTESYSLPESDNIYHPESPLN